MKVLTALALLLVLLVPAAGHAQEGPADDVTLFLGYIPSVQFAPIYVAIEQGYFAEAGINLELEYSFNEADGVDRIAVDDLQFGIISGEQVPIGRGAGKPLVYVFEWYHNFPVGVVVPADSDIEEPGDLAGKRVGIPGPYGASYVALRALLDSADLTELDILLESIGFTAPEQVCAGNVDAAVVYIVNEPLTIEENCFPVRVIQVSDYGDFVSNGLVTNEATLADSPELVAGMVQALQRGVQFTLENPEEAFQISLEYVPDLPEEQYALQQQVLENSLALWDSEALGMTDPTRWEATQTLLLDSGLMSEALDDLSAAYTNEFVPELPDDDSND